MSDDVFYHRKNTVKLFDIEKLAHNIVHPFQDVLEQFTEQMEVLQGQMDESNRINAEILEVLKDR